VTLCRSMRRISKCWLTKWSRVVVQLTECAQGMLRIRKLCKGNSLALGISLAVLFSRIPKHFHLYIGKVTLTSVFGTNSDRPMDQTHSICARI
jgi:hypothetical protein